jgi:hypothetical protein
VFAPDPHLDHVAATREQVVLLVEAINQPQVSIPGKSPQAVTGHIVGLRHAAGTFSVLVGLHLPRTGENVIYVHPEGEVPAGRASGLQEEAQGFLESMGFMLDNLNFRNIGPEQQAAALKRIPIFSPPTAQESPEAEAERLAARLGRLLASF